MKKPRWLLSKERGSTLGIRLIFFVLKRCGYWAVALALPLIAGYFFLTSSESRNACAAYRRRLASSQKSPAPKFLFWRLYKQHLEFAWNVLDRVWLSLGFSKRYQVTRQGKESLHARRGQGVLLIGAHLGSFEVMRALSENEELPIHIVMHQGNSEKIRTVLDLGGASQHIQIHELAPGDLTTVFELQAAIARGEMVATLGDRQPAGSRERVSWVDFLGAPAPFPQNVWLLAHLLHCPVFLVAGCRTGLRRYLVQAELLCEQVVLPRKTRDQAATEYIRAYANFLERCCKQFPEQWFNFYDFWELNDKTKERPKNTESAKA